FSSRRRHTRFSRDWSSDVCSSDLKAPLDKYHRRERLHMADFESLTERMYEAVFLPEMWVPLLDDLARQTGSSVGGIGTYWPQPRAEERRVGRDMRATGGPRDCTQH